VGIEDGDAAAPFEVTDKGGSEFRVGGQPDLVGGIEEDLHPPFPFLFIKHFPDMVGDHNGVAAAVVPGIFFRATEYFGDEIGDMTGMIGGHLPEDGTDEVVLQHLIVKDPEKVLQGGFAPGPLE